MASPGEQENWLLWRAVAIIATGFWDEEKIYDDGKEAYFLAQPIHSFAGSQTLILHINTQ